MHYGFGKVFGVSFCIYGLEGQATLERVRSIDIQNTVSQRSSGERYTGAKRQCTIIITDSEFIYSMPLEAASSWGQVPV